MKLLTQAIRNKLPKLYAQDGKGDDAVVHCKFFTPDSNWTWFVTEGEPEYDEDGKEVDFRFFGLVNGYEQELGYFVLSEMQRSKGPLGLPIERDLYFSPKTLGEVKKEMARV
jgi:hypothetical protein